MLSDFAVTKIYVASPLTPKFRSRGAKPTLSPLPRSLLQALEKKIGAVENMRARLFVSPLCGVITQFIKNLRKLGAPSPHLYLIPIFRKCELSLLQS